jgi:hypothetical protein
MDNKIYKSTINGSISGGVGYIITLPLDAIKQNLQIGNKISYTNILNYFKGGVVGLSSIVPQMAIKFTVNSYLEKNYNFNPFINGFIAGTLDGMFLGPVMSLQSLQQININLTYKEAFNILRNKSLLQLSIPMAMRNGIYTSVLLGGYKSIPNKKNTFIHDLYYASLLNIPATILCCTADVIRANQNKYMLENKNIKVITITKDIYNKQGIMGFFKGYKMLYVNFAIRFPFTLAIFNYINKITF